MGSKMVSTKPLIILGLFAALAAPVVFSGCGKEKPLAAKKPETVNFTTSDEITIFGTLREPAEPSGLYIVALHMLRKNRKTYDAIARTWVGEGFTVLAIDSRGHGESTKENTIAKVSPDDERMYVNAWKDVEAAVTYLEKRFPGAAKNTSILGASIGANHAYRYAAKDPGIQCLVLLSPGINYHNAMTEDAAKEYAGPVLLISSEGDQTRKGPIWVKQLASLAPNSTEHIYNGSAEHGSDLFGKGLGLEKKILEFFTDNMEKR